MSLDEFKKGIAKQAKVLRTHGLLDPLNRVGEGYKKFKKAVPTEKPVKDDLLDDFFTQL